MASTEATRRCFDFFTANTGSKRKYGLNEATQSKTTVHTTRHLGRDVEWDDPSARVTQSETICRLWRETQSEMTSLLGWRRVRRSVAWGETQSKMTRLLGGRRVRRSVAWVRHKMRQNVCWDCKYLEETVCRLRWRRLRRYDGWGDADWDDMSAEITQIDTICQLTWRRLRQYVGWDYTNWDYM